MSTKWRKEAVQVIEDVAPWRVLSRKAGLWLQRKADVAMSQAAEMHSRALFTCWQQLGHLGCFVFIILLFHPSRLQILFCKAPSSVAFFRKTAREVLAAPGGERKEARASLDHCNIALSKPGALPSTAATRRSVWQDSVHTDSYLHAALEHLIALKALPQRPQGCN